MQERILWEGPATAIVKGALLFPGHASVWLEGANWGGQLVIDAFAPLEKGLPIELEFRGDAYRRRIAVSEIATMRGIQSATATTVTFRGEGQPPTLQ